jgi:hypothetical protein
MASCAVVVRATTATAFNQWEWEWRWGERIVPAALGELYPSYLRAAAALF